MARTWTFGTLGFFLFCAFIGVCESCGTYARMDRIEVTFLDPTASVAMFWEPGEGSNLESFSFVANTENITSILIGTQVTVADILVRGNITNNATSTLVIQDTSTSESTSLSIIGNQNQSKIEDNGLFVLDTFSPDVPISLNLETELFFESGSVFSWQRGTIHGNNESLIVIRPGATLEITPSSHDTPIARSLSATLEVESDWIFSPYGFDVVNCLEIGPVTLVNRAEMIIENTQVSLKGNAFVRVDYESTENIIKVSNSAMLIGDSSIIDSGNAQWLITENSFWNQSQSSHAEISHFRADNSVLNLKQSSVFTIIGGSFSMIESDANIIDNSVFSILNGTFAETSKSAFRTDSNSQVVVGSDSYFRIDTFGKAYFMDDTSSIVVRDNSVLELIGSITLDESSTVTVANSSEFIVNGLRNCEVEETYTCYCNCNITSSHRSECGEGVGEAECLDSCLASGLSCNPNGECESWQCDGFCETTCPTGYKVRDAILIFQGRTRFDIGGSVFRMAFGNVTMAEMHKLQMKEAKFKITAGEFYATDDTSLDFVAGELEVVGGSITFQDSSQLRAIEGSELEVQTGTIEFGVASRIQMTLSEIELSGGQLHFAGDSSFVSSGTRLDGVDDLEVPENRNSTADTMEVKITSGRMFFSERSYAQFLNGTEVTIFGQMIMINESRLESTNSTFDVFAQSICADPVVLCSCGCPDFGEFELLCAPGVDVETCEHQCKDSLCDNDVNDCGMCDDNCFEVCPGEEESLEGKVILRGNSEATFDISNITITEGSLETSESHSLEVRSSVISIFDGFWISRQSSKVRFSDSSLSIGGVGEFTLTENAEFVQENSTMEVSSSVLLEGFEVNSTNSTIRVGGGVLTFAGSCKSQFEGGSIALTGEGNIFATEQSDSSFSNSQVDITAGTMFVQDTAILSLSQTSKLNISSSLITSGDSFITVDQSIVIVGGNFTLSGSSISSITSSIVSIGTSLLENSGNIILYDNSILEVTESSVATLTGNLEISGTSRCLVSNNSSIVVEGNGQLVVSDNSSLTITSNSVVSVAQGSVVISDFGRIDISDNSILITDDLLDLRGDTEISVPEGNQFIIDTNGQVQVNQQLDVVSSSALGSSAAPSVDNSGILDMSASTGGNIFIPIANRANGLVSFGSSHFNLVNVQNSGQVFFSKSRVSLVDNTTTGDASQPTKKPLQMGRGSQSQGIIDLDGDFTNEGEIRHDESEGSLYEIRGRYSSTDESTLYITILDPSQPGSGYTFVNVQDSAHLAGRVEICIPNSAKLGKTKKLDVFKFGKLLNKFSDVTFRCSSGHNSASYAKVAESKRLGKELKVTEHKMLKAAGSCSSTEYSSGSFTVLFDGCGDSDSSQSWLYQWLSLGFILGFLVLMIIAIALYEVKPIRKLLKGSEGSRLDHVRKVQSQLRSGSLTLQSEDSLGLEEP